MSTNTSILSYRYRVDKARDFVADVDANANSMFYMFAARPLPFPGGDSIVPSPNDSVQSTMVDTYKNMLFGKHIKNSDVNLMIPRHDWTSNTIYTQYDHTDGDLQSKQFYVGVQTNSQYDVFKVLSNANGNPSTQAPTLSDTSPADIYYQTSDGYQWKYMFSADEATFTKFATTDFVPVVPVQNVVGNAASGSIDFIAVITPGAGYTNYTDGHFSALDIKVGGNTVLYNITANGSSTNGAYAGGYIVLTNGTGKGQFKSIETYTVIGLDKQIVIDSEFTVTPDATTTYDISPKVQIFSDGNQTTNAIARAIVNSVGNTINRVEILERGVNYFVATANVFVPSVLSIDTDSELRPIIPPRGGHGYDVVEELGGFQVAIVSKFQNTESNTITAVNDFRTFGLIKNPQFANVTVSIEASDGTPGSNGSFVVGTTVTQDNTGAYGIIIRTSGNNIVLTNVNGILQTGNSTHNVIRSAANAATAQVPQLLNNDAVKGFETFNQTFRYLGPAASGTFLPDEIVWQISPATANAEVVAVSTAAGTTTLSVVNTYTRFNVGNTITGNSSGAILTVTDRFMPDVVIGSGDVFYVENISPVTRSNSTTESITLILGF